jgi:hypothetical protein
MLVVAAAAPWSALERAIVPVITSSLLALAGAVAVAAAGATVLDRALGVRDPGVALALRIAAVAGAIAWTAPQVADSVRAFGDASLAGMAEVGRGR